MKTQNTIFISALALICTLTVNSQETDRKVQMRIIENGKVVTDTTFSVNDKVDRNDIDRVERTLNKEDVFEFRELPGKRGFAYGFHFDGDRYNDFDSIMRKNRMYFNHDSIFEDFAKHFNNDSMFAFRNFDHPGMMHPKMRPHQRIMEREIITDDENDIEGPQDEVIIRKDKPGKKQIIIRDDDGDVKTIRKKLDKDTEVIIIKKKMKNN
ncbi:MAG TPA: hypothetical protein VHO90_19365 [Bacteroidales bacterium]|nr:hypothetical protein [Bacteroidales bacterium]